MRRLGVVMLGALALAGCKDEAVVLDAAAVARGQDAFETCAACHAIKNEESGVGPHLVDIIGRKAGAAEGYAYSAGLAGSDIVWTPEQMVAFLLDPAGMVPGTKMALGEITKDEASDVTTYLQSLQQ